MKQRKFTYGIVWLGVCWVLLSMAGCEDESLSGDEYDFVITAYDVDYNFPEARTFAMPEEVFDLSDLVQDPVELDHSKDQLILNTVAEQMAAYGYDRVADPQSTEADVVLAVGAVAVNNLVYGTAYWYWYDYYYWYGWGYPYPTTVAVQVPSGTVVLMMFDPEEADAALEQLPVIWSAGISGLLGYFTSDEIVGAIEQAFEQSAYLEAGPPVAAKPGLEEPEFDTEVDTGTGGQP